MKYNKTFRQALNEVRTGNLKEQEGQTEFSKDEVSKLNAEIQRLKMELEQEKNKSQNAVPNKDTGEIPLQTGIGRAILKIKDREEKEKAQQKQASKKIEKLARESLFQKSLGVIRESDASDKAKALGLDYLKFGRYGKDGKVTHKSIGGTLTAVDKDEKPIKDPKGAKTDEPTGDTPADTADDSKIKAKNLLKDFEDDFDFDDESSFEDAIEKARKEGLDDLADELEGVAGYVAEMEPDNAESEYQDLKASLTGKQVRAVVLSKKANTALEIFNDQEYLVTVNGFRGMSKDLSATFDIIQKMVDSDETEGSPGSGMRSSSKGFRSEVIDTLQSLEDVSMKLEDIKDEIKDEKIKSILSEIQDEIEFVTDENADHDGYTKSHKVNGSIESIRGLIKSIAKTDKVQKEQVELDEGYENNMVTHLGELGIDVSFRLGKMIVYKRELQRVKDALKDGIADRGSAIWNHRMPDIKTFGEEVKEAKKEEGDFSDTVGLKDLIKSKLKKKLKLDDKKSKVEVNPDVKVGVASGGNETGSGNLY